MYLAIDIGGTKTLLAVFDGQGSLKEQLRFPTTQDYAQFLEELAKNVAKLTTKSFRACGVGAPGRLDRKHGIGIAFGNLPWQSVPITDDIEALLSVPVVIENDSKLAGLSEAILIKDKFKKVLYVTIGTGIGGAVIINGVIDRNLRDSEPGHMLLEHQGKLMRWEDFASGPAILAKFGKPIHEITDKADLYKIARNIALGLIDLIAVVSPDAIVVGGGVGAHLEKFQDQLAEQLKIYENPLVKIPPILNAKRAEEAVIYGCFELAKHHHAPLN